MKAQLERIEDRLVFSGTIDHQGVPALMSSNVDLGDDKNELVLDVSQVEKIDSAGLAYFINWGKINLKTEQKVKLSGVSEQATKLINIMGLATVFELVG